MRIIYKNDVKPADSRVKTTMTEIIEKDKDTKVGYFYRSVEGSRSGLDFTNFPMEIIKQSFTGNGVNLDKFSRYDLVIVDHVDVKADENYLSKILDLWGAIDSFLGINIILVIKSTLTVDAISKIMLSKKVE